MNIQTSLLTVKSKPAAKKRIDSRLVLILSIVCIQEIAWWMVEPIIPIYAQQEFGASGLMVGLIFAGLHMVRPFSCPLIGRISDRKGRIPILILSQVGTLIAFILLATAQNAWMLLVARLIDSLTGGNIILAQAYLTDIFPKEKRTEALSYFWAAEGVGVFVGALSAGFISMAGGSRLTCWIAAMITVGIILLTWRALPETVIVMPKSSAQMIKQAKNRLSWKRLLNQRTLLSLLLVTILLRFAFGSVWATATQWGLAIPFAKMSSTQAGFRIGMVLAIVGLVQMLVQFVILRPMIRRFGDKYTLLIGGIARAVGIALFALVVLPMGAYTAALVYALGLGVSRPVLPSMITKAVDENMSGQALGIFNAAASIGMVAGMLSAGMLVTIHPALQFWVSLVVVSAALIIMVTIPRDESKPIVFFKSWRGKRMALTAEIAHFQAENAHLQAQVALLQTQLNEDDKAKKRRLHNTINALSYANANLYNDYTALKVQLRDKEQDLAQLQNTMAHIGEQLTPYSMTSI